MTEKEKNFDLNIHCYRLLSQEPFFSALSRHINKKEDKSVPTLGVKYNKKTTYFDLVYNSKFLNKLSEKEITAVLKHEFYHILFGHLTSREYCPFDEKDIGNSEKIFNRRLWNIAKDLSINCFIEDLPEDCLFPGKGDFKDFEPFLTCEQYYQLINNNKSLKEKISKQYEQFEFDIHFDADGNIEIGGSGSAIVKERIKQILNKAVQEASAKGWGTVSKDLQSKIISILKGKLNWKNVLRYFVRTSRRSEKYNSQRKVNKRLPYIQPGKRIRRYAKIAISIDQSGSVSDNLLSKFFSELNNLSEIVSFTVIPFDSEVDEEKVYEWKKGKKYTAERVLCGGTDFNAPTKYVNERDFDGHIILTDLEAPVPEKSKCKRLWLTEENNYNNNNFNTKETILCIK